MKKAALLIGSTFIIILILYTNAHSGAQYQKISKLPQTFQLKNDICNAKFTITPTSSNSDEYLVEGVFNYTPLGLSEVLDKGVSSNTPPSRLILHLAKNDKALRDISIFFNERDLSKPIAFKKTFRSNPFDQVSFGYALTVR